MGKQLLHRAIPVLGWVIVVGQLSLGWVIMPLPAIAQDASSNPDVRGYAPPDRGLPGNREAGSTRGSTIIEGQPLTALIPDTNFGVTLAEYPTFFFYIPPTDGLTAEFSLWDADDNLIHQTQLLLPQTSGVISVSLPTDGTLPPLAVGQDYYWSFSIIVDPEERLNDSHVEGWVQRVTPEPRLAEALEQAAPADRPALYAGSGIWFDALTELAALRQANPQNETAIAQWEDLLDSVGLEAIAPEPLLDMPVTETPQSHTLPTSEQTGAYNLPDLRPLDRPVPATPMPTPTPSPQATDEETSPDPAASEASESYVPPDIRPERMGREGGGRR